MSKKNNNRGKVSGDGNSSSELSNISNDRDIPDIKAKELMAINIPDNYDDIDEEAKEEYIKTVVLDKVINYIKIDDIIKNKQIEFKKEMLPVKKMKQDIEKFLVNYLDKVEEEYIIIGDDSKLTKTKVVTKKNIKIEDVTKGLIEGLKKHNVGDDQVVKDIIDMIEMKRGIKTKSVIKRSKNKNT
jgi:hypothetical protein